MSWEESNQGWLRFTELDFGDRVGFVVIRPLLEKHRLKRGDDHPPDHNTWLLSGLFVEEEHRGKGKGRALIAEAIEKIQEIESGEFWFGLMTDNLKGKAGRTRTDIKGCWLSFFEEGDHESYNDFVLIGG